MIKEILDLLKLREERVTFLGREYLVREMAASGSMGAPLDEKNPEDQEKVLWWRMFVRCVFDVEGKQVFADDDIAELRIGSRMKLAPLMLAVDRVNGMDEKDNAKNSQAVQA